jgi:predicted MFS family arabinose efflux permease
VRSLTLMAALWSLATLGCALANSFGEMFLARLCVGIGEAAYGSVGIAVVVSVFPRHLRASLSAAFIAGGAFGSVLGMGLGGVISAHFGWRVAFAGMALFGLILVALYRLLITEKGLLARRQELGEDVSASQTQAKLELARWSPRCSPPDRFSAPMWAARCNCSSWLRCWPGCRATSAAITA